MKRNIIMLVTAGLFLLCSANDAHCQRTNIRASDTYVTKDFLGLGNFDAIHVTGSIGVEFRQVAGNSASVSAYGSDNVLEFLVVENKNGALTVSLRRNVNIRGDHRLVVMVTGPAITEGHVTGSGDLHIPGSLDGGDISFKVTGSGKVEVGRLIAGKLAVSIAGSGDVVINECVAKNVYGTVTGSGDIRLLAGNAAYAEYNVRGSGDIRAFVMRAEKVMATVSGSGNVECSAKTGLEANVSGSGRIIYEGNAVVRNNGKKESVIMR